MSYLRFLRLAPSLVQFAQVLSGLGYIGASRLLARKDVMRLEQERLGLLMLAERRKARPQAAFSQRCLWVTIAPNLVLDPSSFSVERKGLLAPPLISEYFAELEKITGKFRVLAQRKLHSL